jgi:hypothetical protein
MRFEVKLLTALWAPSPTQDRAGEGEFVKHLTK